MKYKIQIDNPCSQSWEEMASVEGGKFCQSCQKKVMDLTELSDYELVSILKNSKNTCGKVKLSQLNKDISVPKKNNHHSRIAALFGLTSFLAVQEPIHSQTQEVITEITASSDINKKKVVKKAISDTIINITGTVEDDIGLPLPGVNVILKGTNKGTQTDFDGYFYIQQIPITSAGDKVEIVFSYVGFESLEVLVDKNTQQLDLRLKPKIDYMQEIFITGGIGIKRYSREVKRDTIFQKIKNSFRKEDR